MLGALTSLRLLLVVVPLLQEVLHPLQPYLNPNHEHVILLQHNVGSIRPAGERLRRLPAGDSPTHLRPLLVRVTLLQGDADLGVGLGVINQMLHRIGPSRSAELKLMPSALRKLATIWSVMLFLLRV